MKSVDKKPEPACCLLIELGFPSTLPVDLTEAVGFEIGDYFEVSLEGGRLVLTRQGVMDLDFPRSGSNLRLSDEPA